MLRTLIHAAFAVAALALLATALLYVFQRQLIYLPTRLSVDALRAEVERRFGRRGQLLEPFGAIVVEPPAGTPASGTALLFHGNAGSAIDRAVLAPPFAARGLRLVLAEYPGYGTRDGRPSQDAIVADAQALQAELRRRYGSDAPMLLVGESLGSGVAALLAVAPGAAPPPERLVLLTPFESLAETAARHYPWLPVRRLVKDRFDVATALRGYDGPLAVLIAGRDEVLGPEQARALVAQARGRGAAVEAVELPANGHNDWHLAVTPQQWDRLLGRRDRR